jgi:hypothetical protein
MATKKRLRKMKITKSLQRLGKAVHTMNMRLQAVPETEEGGRGPSGRPLTPPPLPQRVLTNSSHEDSEIAPSGPPQTPSPILESMNDEPMGEEEV